MDTIGAERVKVVTGPLEVRSRTETTPSERPTARKREAGDIESARIRAEEGELGEISPRGARAGGVRKVSEEA